MTWQAFYALSFRIVLDLPGWMAGELAVLSEEQANQVLVDAYRLYYSSKVNLPLEREQSWQEETQDALKLWFKTHHVEKPQLPRLPEKRTASVSLLGAKRDVEYRKGRAIEN